MEDPDSQPSSKNTADEKAGGVSADAPAENAESPTETSGENTVTRPTAIERQAAAAASRSGYGHPTHQEAAGRPIEWHEPNLYADRRRPPPPSRSGLVSFLLLLLAAAGVALIYTTDLGRPVQRAVSAALEAVEQTVARHNPPSVIPSPVPSPETPLPVTPSSNTPPPAVASRTGDVSQTAATEQKAAPKATPEMATPGAVSVPIADVSPQTRPELLEQLAQVYKSKLAVDPNDLEALAALDRLQERSLTELETMVAAGDHSTTARSLEVISRVFPEVVDTARYKYLAARANYIPSKRKAESAAKPQLAAPSTTTVAPVVAPPIASTIEPATTAPMPSDSSAEIAKKPAKNVSKPTIHVVSMTPGAMVENQFSPRHDGNVFKVQISYRNFENIQNLSEATLVARLGIPGDPMVLGEAPVELLGGRGTKSFLMESLRPGNIGERYKLNFLLNDEYFASSTVRLSMPEQ